MKYNQQASPFTAMHDSNRRRVLEEVLRGERVTRQEIKERTGLTHATVSRITREFIQAGVLRDGDKVRERGMGRRRVEVNINVSAGYVVGICLSAFQRSVSVVDVEGRRCMEHHIPASIMHSPLQVVQFIGDAVDRIAREERIPRSRILGAGVVVAGSVTEPDGAVTHAPLLSWTNVPLGRLLRDRLEIGVSIRNVADALCLACLDRLYAKDGSGLQLFLVHVAVGMGGSLMIGGHLVNRRGDEGWIASVPAALPPTSPGERLGDLVSGRAILAQINAQAGRLDRHAEDAEIAERLVSAVATANQHDGTEREVFARAGERLGSVLGIVTAAVLPDVLILAGPVSRAQSFRERAEASYRNIRRMLDDKPVEVVGNPSSYLEAAENLGLREYLLEGLLSRPG